MGIFPTDQKEDLAQGLTHTRARTPLDTGLGSPGFNALSHHCLLSSVMGGSPRARVLELLWGLNRTCGVPAAVIRTFHMVRTGGWQLDWAWGPKDSP